MKTLLKHLSDVLRIAVTFSDLRPPSAVESKKRKRFYAGRVKVDYQIPVTHSHSEQ